MSRQVTRTETIENEGRTLEVLYSYEKWSGYDTDVEIEAMTIGEFEFVKKDFSATFIKSLISDIILHEFKIREEEYQSQGCGYDQVA